MDQPSITSADLAMPEWSQLRLAIDHACLLQRGQQAASRAWLDGAEALTAPPLLRTWVASRLHAALPGTASQLPAGPQSVWQGWLNYEANQPLAALAEFSTAWRMLWHPSPRHWCAELADAALGLGKCLTRTGHWQAARGWLLAALTVARRTRDESLCVHGYGALGELLLRAGHADAAFACLNTAYHLLPAGSGQRARQLNYLGSALRRLDQPLRAESLLMTSLYMARDRGDSASQWHALARLQHIELTRSAPLDLSAAWPELLPPADTAPPAALGHLNLARSRLPGHLDRKAALADQAVAAFRQGFLVMEQCWAAHWQQQFDPSAATAAALAAAQAAARDLMAVQPPAPPSTTALPVVLDQGFASLDLRAGNGFAALLAPVASDELARLGHLFFV